MDAWDRRSRPYIIVAAVAPIVLALISTRQFDSLALAIDLAAWFVFLIDFVVRHRIDRSYWRSGNGIFDLVILVITFPWYIFPFAGGSDFMAVFRLARVARLFTAAGVGNKSVKVFRRLGKLGIWLAGLSVIAALIVLHSEPPSSGFETFGDAIWWALVSFTTVGYGDLYPVTPMGRLAGVLMMVAGLAALGTVAAVLGSALGATDEEDEDSMEGQILHELSALRSEVADLKDRLDRDE